MRTEHIRFLPERPRGVVSDAGSTGVASDGASQDPAGGIDTTHVPTESGPVATYDGSDEPLLGSEYLSILSSVQINRSINSFLWTTAAADAVSKRLVVSVSVGCGRRQRCCVRIRGRGK